MDVFEAVTAPEGFRNPLLPVQERVQDLMGRLPIEDKIGLMFHDIAMLPSRDSHDPAAFGRPSIEEAIKARRMTHFYLAGTPDSPRQLAEWYNEIQDIAASTGLGIPITLSSDPRNSFAHNPGTSFEPGPFSQWPEALGLAALRDPDLVRRFADVVRQEWISTGLRTSINPQADLLTEPRWARGGMTFGEDADLAASCVKAYIEGLQGPAFGRLSVSTMTKHFPGGGPQKDGEDPHFAYGKEQIYPGGNFDYHLKPFVAAIAAGGRQMMPYYGVPIGTKYEEVGFGFNRGIINDLLRVELGFEGIVCTDFAIITGDRIFGEDLPARAWGVEHLSPKARIVRALEAGVDQFGGQSQTELLLELVRSGEVPEARIDVSARRLLTEKFLLGLFDDPFVDVEAAEATVGRPDFVAEGLAAQRAAIVRLKQAPSGPASLPMVPGLRIYAEGLEPEVVSQLGQAVEAPEQADVAVLRLAAPYEKRPGGFESFFHAGSLEFPEAERNRLLAICAAVPTVVDVYLDRPAVFPELAAAVETLTVNFGACAAAFLDVLRDPSVAKGRLPFDLPSSDAAVRDSRSDTPFDTVDPLYRFGSGM